MLGRYSIVMIASMIILCSVCACGEWVCTKNDCETEEEDTEDDPEDDPDIQDIRWF